MYKIFPKKSTSKKQKTPVVTKTIHKIEKEVERDLEKIEKNLDKDELGKYLLYLKSPWRIWWSHILAGLAYGLGFVIGASLLVSLLLYIFYNFLINLPWVGESFKWFGENFNFDEIQNFGSSIYQIQQQLNQQTDLLNEILNSLQ